MEEGEEGEEEGEGEARRAVEVEDEDGEEKAGEENEEVGYGGRCLLSCRVLWRRWLAAKNALAWSGRRRARRKRGAVAIWRSRCKGR